MTTAMATNDMTLSNQWATRPDDQRYTSLEGLLAAVQARRDESWTENPLSGKLRVLPHPERENDLAVVIQKRMTGTEHVLYPTHWGFGQLAQLAGAPAQYLRKIDPQLAAINLQWGLEHQPARDDALVLARSNGSEDLRAITSTSYGRIYDNDVVSALVELNRRSDGRWVIPDSSYTSREPRRATTLYASDRDVFCFLCDPKNPITIGNDTLFRGFYVWNSEVGSLTFGLKMFLYRYVCDNRIIWGQQDARELRIRHTAGAPDRFIREAAPALTAYAESATAGMVEQIKRAKEMDVPVKKTGAEKQPIQSWLRDRGFTVKQSEDVVKTAEKEEGEARSLWDIVNGVTAMARGVKHTDERVKLEAAAGELMKFAA